MEVIKVTKTLPVRSPILILKITGLTLLVSPIGQLTNWILNYSQTRVLRWVVIRIREVVQEAMTTGYLTVQAEDLLRQMLRTKYDLEDFKAFISLQQAAMNGYVQQESRLVLVGK